MKWLSFLFRFWAPPPPKDLRLRQSVVRMGNKTVRLP